MRTFEPTPNWVEWPINEDYEVKDHFLIAKGAVKRSYSLNEKAENRGGGSLVTAFSRLRFGDERAAIRFAKSWGLPGYFAPNVRPWRIDRAVTLAEDPLFWVWSAAHQVRLTLELKLYQQDGDSDSLKEALEGHQAASPLDELRESVEFLLAFADEQELHDRAKQVISDFINENLFTSVHLFVQDDPPTIKPYLASPVAAVYWALGQQLAGGVVRRCDWCRKPFPVTHGSERFCPPDEYGTASRCGANSRQAARRARSRLRTGVEFA